MLIKRAIPTMGTVVSIHVNAEHGAPDDVYLALARARASLMRADAVFSTWKHDSPVSRLRRDEIAVDEAPAEVAEVLDVCAVLRGVSGGWFDAWAMPGGVDPTGMVKGWAAQRVLSLLAGCGAAGAMVSAGGDIAVFGRPDPDRAWRVGVQDPFDRGAIAAVVEPAAAIATSGCYARGMHVIDPFTGSARAAVASATVTGPDLGVADALATALVAGGTAALGHVEALGGYEALLIAHDGARVATGGFVLGTGQAAMATAP